MRRNICIALDVDDLKVARLLVRTLAPLGPIFKVGSHLFAGGEGRRIIDEIHGAGARVFLDLKYHDIPNTVANAARVATRMGVFMFNVHSLGGSVMMKMVADVVGEEAVKNGLPRPIVVAITVLTSMSREDLKRDLMVSEPLDRYVIHLATLSQRAGLDGVVCSPHEIRLIKEACGSDFVVVTPGIRPAWSSEMHDQKRVLTPRQAFDMGADYIVVGRPVIKAPDPLSALQELNKEVNGE